VQFLPRFKLPPRASFTERLRARVAQVPNFATVVALAAFYQVLRRVRFLLSFLHKLTSLIRFLFSAVSFQMRALLAICADVSAYRRFRIFPRPSTTAILIAQRPDVVQSLNKVRIIFENSFMIHFLYNHSHSIAMRCRQFVHQQHGHFLCMNNLLSGSINCPCVKV